MDRRKFMKIAGLSAAGIASTGLMQAAGAACIAEVPGWDRKDKELFGNRPKGHFSIRQLSSVTDTIGNSHILQTKGGKVIVIDPGHGYGKTATKLDPGGIGYVTEQSVNLAVSKLLEQKLTAMGATVVRLKTESEFILTNTRPSVARTYGADMFISLHCNSVLNEQAHGVEVYYHTPYSQPLAKYINDNLVSYYDNTVYADGTNSNRGDKYSYYWVTLQHDFPTVLVEMGFVTNERECMVMADPTHQEGIAQAIAQGVKAYFARSGLSYSSGSSEAPDAPTTPDTPDQPPAPPTDEPTAPGTDEPEVPETDESEPTEPTAESEEPVPATTDEPEIPTTDEPDDPGGGGIRVE